MQYTDDLNRIVMLTVKDHMFFTMDRVQAFSEFRPHCSFGRRSQYILHCLLESGRVTHSLTIAPVFNGVSVDIDEILFGFRG